MQIKSLRIKSYRSWAIADTASEAAILAVPTPVILAEGGDPHCEFREAKTQ